MIDGVQFTYHTKGKALLKLPIWNVEIHEQTGKRVNDERNANFRSMYLKLKPCTNNNGFNLLANGSLHKWYNCGEHNNNDFSFLSLYDTICSVTSALIIDPSQCYLHGLEIGLNIVLPFTALRVIKNVVCYKGKPFTQINKRNTHKGIVCSLSDYDVKLYDKAAQSKSEGGKVLRFEIHLHKMRVIKDYEIATLLDLQNPFKTYALKNLLIDVLSSIVWTDTAVQLSMLSNREQKQWLYLCNQTSWQSMNKRKAYREREKVCRLIQKHGNKIDLKPLILTTWETLFFDVLEAQKMGLFHQHIFKKEAEKNGTISQLECYVKRSHILDQNTRVVNTTISKEISINKERKKCAKDEQIKNVRTCKSCGNDITRQHYKSVFCSELIRGKAAKKCRNKNSNTRRLLKDKIKKAMIQQNFIAVTYTENEKTYTDTLHPTEIMLQRTWIDKVVRVEILPTLYGEAYELITGEEAKNYMKQFLHKP